MWCKCWCPLLQGIARMCCDMRRDVRMSALTYLQRALLVHDLQALSAVEWEACFNKVTLVSHLTGEFNVPLLNSTELCPVFCVVTFLSWGKTSSLPLNFSQSSIRFASKPKIRLFGSCHIFCSLLLPLCRALWRIFVFFSFYFINAHWSDNTSNGVSVLGHRYILGLSQSWF